MNTNDQQAFKAILTGACDMYDKKITETLIKLYWAQMRNISIDQFKEVIDAHMLDPDSGRFFPKPADIMKQISGTAKDKAQAIDNKCELAWSQLMHEIGSTGPYRSLRLDDKQAVAAVKAIGGWQKFCTYSYDELVWVKKEFFSIYETYEHTELEKLPSSLPGLPELKEHKKEQQNTMKSLSEGLDDYKKRHRIEQT